MWKWVVWKHVNIFKTQDEVGLPKYSTVKLSISKITKILILTYKTNITLRGSALITLQFSLVFSSTLKNTNIKPHTMHYACGLC